MVAGQAAQFGQLLQVLLVHGLYIVTAGFRAKRHAAIEPCGYAGLATGVEVATKTGRDLQGQFDFRALQAPVQFIRVPDGRLLGEIA